MSGFEYAAAATMLQYGMVDQGLDIVKAISERYDGRLRAKGEVHMANNSTVFGTGSPFGEDECGDYYVRPLSSWSVLLALQGFIYDGPGKTIGFKPQWHPENHVSFFSASTGWGLFFQTQNNSGQNCKLEVKYGTVQIQTIELATPDNKKGSNVMVMLDGIQQSIISSKQNGNKLTINLKSECKIKTGSKLMISLDF